MSWTLNERAYAAFEEEAQGRLELAKPFVLDVWEQIANGQEHGWKEHKVINPARLAAEPVKHRIIFAPLDLPQRWTKQQFLDLFNALAIPPAFIEERLQQASHSFGAMDDAHGSSAWFHFLCKNVEVENVTTQENFIVPAVAYHAGADPSRAMLQNIALAPSHGTSKTFMSSASGTPNTEDVAKPLPQSDNSYIRSGFFLRSSPAGIVTLCCFEATANVRSIIGSFLNTSGWVKISKEPYLLFDLIIAGLFVDVDENVWNMNHIYGALEYRTLVNKSPRKRHRSKEFAGMHNVAKHITHLGEAVESCLLVIDGLLSRLQQPGDTFQPGTSDLRMRKQLQDSLRHRQSLFRSTKLRLGSLRERVTNSITLSFNLLTTSDSVVMLEHSNSMKILSFITLAFLPTSTLASILGSQLFSTELDASGVFTILATPLFPVLWYVAVPLTVGLAVCSWIWARKTFHENPKGKKYGPQNSASFGLAPLGGARS